MMVRFPATGLVVSGARNNAAAIALLKRFNSTVEVASPASEDLSKARPFQDIPGPKPLPIIGNVWRFLPKIGEYGKLSFIDQQQALYNQFGKIVKLVDIIGKKDMVFLFDPHDIEKLFRNEGQWPKRGGFESLAYYRQHTRKDFYQGKGGALVSQGEEWQNFRTKVNQPMLQPRTAKLYIAPIDDVSKDFIKRIRHIRNEELELPSDFMNEMYRWALESIVTIALDTRLGCLDPNMKPESEPQKMINAIQSMFDSFFTLDAQVSLWPWISTPTWRKYIKTLDYFNEVCMKYINEAIERMKNRPPDSTRELSVLERLLARDEDPRTACIMALDMMMAGVDTTSNSVSFLMYLLAKNQDKQQKLYEEIKRVLPSNTETTITAENLNAMVYLKACIKESMRICPIAVGNIREIPKDLTFQGYLVPKGTEVVTSHMLLSNMEEHYPEPARFIPERWLKDNPEKSQAHSFVTMPFGFGPRMCLGRRFAELELETLITRMILNFRVEYHHGEMTYANKLILSPGIPLRFKMVDRE